MPDPGDGDDGSEILRREARKEGTGKDDAPSAPVFRDEDRVGRRAELPVPRAPQRGEVMVRVYTAWIGVESRSTLSRKKGRFSGKKRANRSLTPI